MQKWSIPLQLLDGVFKQAWVSREGVAEAAGRQFSHTVDIRLTPEFDPATDYLIEETLSAGGKKFVLKLLAGTAPDWFTYPALWREWVTNPEVQESAHRFIADERPDVTGDLERAWGTPRKEEKIRAYRAISDRVGAELVLRAGSWTSVEYMPIRIAEELGWTPPIARPEYADPKMSGRVLLASPFRHRRELEAFQRTERRKGRSLR